MSVLPVWVYLAAFVGAAVLSLYLTPLALRFALRKDVLDHPGGHKRHASPVPYLGGVAIVASFSVVVILAALLRQPTGGVGELAAIVGLALAVSVVGLLDDLKGLGALVRVGAVVLAAVGVWSAGIQVELVHVPAVDVAITIVWIVGITNAFNLLDNMDGLSAGTAAIGATFFFVIAALNGQFLVAALAVALAGCAVGFLRHNFHPARIYMGDAGSLFIGFLLAVLGVKLSVPTTSLIAAFVPILVLGVAIFDTTLVTATRLVNGRSPFAGGRDHLSHRLVHVGVPVPIAVGMIYGAAVALGWLAVVMARIQDLVTANLLLGFSVAVAACLGVLLGQVPVYESSKRRRLMIREVAEHEAQPSEQPIGAAEPEHQERARAR